MTTITLTPPTIDSIPVQLGDVVRFPTVGNTFDNGRIKGWSPCGTWLYVSWVGVIATALCKFEQGIDSSAFVRIYPAVRSNQWGTAEDWGLTEESRRIVK